MKLLPRLRPNRLPAPSDPLQMAPEVGQLAMTGEIQIETPASPEEQIARSDRYFSHNALSDVKRYEHDDPGSREYQNERAAYATAIDKEVKRSGYNPHAPEAEFRTKAREILSDYFTFTDTDRNRHNREEPDYASREEAKLALVKASVRKINKLGRNADVTADELEKAEQATGIPFAKRTAPMPQPLPKSEISPVFGSESAPDPFVSPSQPRVRLESYLYNEDGTIRDFSKEASTGYDTFTPLSPDDVARVKRGPSATLEAYRRRRAAENAANETRSMSPLHLSAKERADHARQVEGRRAQAALAHQPTFEPVAPKPAAKLQDPAALALENWRRSREQTPTPDPDSTRVITSFYDDAPAPERTPTIQAIELPHARELAAAGLRRRGAELRKFGEEHRSHAGRHRASDERPAFVSPHTTN